MKFSIPAAPRNYPESTGFEPLPCRAAKEAIVIGREPHSHFPIRVYVYLESCSLPEYGHPTEWVKARFTDMADFRGNGHSSPNSLIKLYLTDLTLPRVETWAPQRKALMTGGVLATPILARRLIWPLF